jgi:hypothetical protein
MHFTKIKESQNKILMISDVTFLTKIKRIIKFFV